MLIKYEKDMLVEQKNAIPHNSQFYLQIDLNKNLK